MESANKLSGIRSKYPISGAQLDVLTRMSVGWVLGESGKAFHPPILQKGGIGSGLDKMHVTRPALNALLRKGLISAAKGEPCVFIMTETGRRPTAMRQNRTDGSCTVFESARAWILSIVSILSMGV